MVLSRGALGLVPCPFEPLLPVPFQPGPLLLKVGGGFQYRVEFYYEATLIGGLDGLSLDPREILEARLFSVEDLPVGMAEVHRELATAR